MSGKIIMIGGGEIKKVRNTFNSHLLSQLFADIPIKNTLLVFPPGSEDDIEEGEKKYRLVFNKIFNEDPQCLVLEDKKQTKKADVERLLKAQLVFFTGGQQDKIMRALSKDFIKLIQDRYKQDDDLIIAGTSAGAMIFPKNIITGGGNSNPQVNERINLISGLNLLPYFIVDTHFIERGRFARLAHVIKCNTQCIGLGIESDSAILLEDDKLKTYGRGTITFIDGARIKKNNHSKDCVLNLKVHLLTSGCSFNIKDL